MRAAVLQGHGGPEVLAVFDDLPLPEPGPGEVRLRMRAAALNRLDLWVRAGWPGLNLDFPHVIAADGAGEVDRCGPGVTGLQPGMRVCVDPAVIAEDDPAIRSGLENQGRLHILGEQRAGTAAQFAIVPARNLLQLPDHVRYEDAAAAGLVYVTAWHSLVTRGCLLPGETVLIVGAAGGVNSASIQIARLAGAQVIVVGSTAERCDVARSLGAHQVIVREDTPDWSREVWRLTGRRGADVTVDNVGSATLGDSLRATRAGGRILVVGNTSGPRATLDLPLLYIKHLSIIGSTMGPHQDYCQVMELVFSGALTPLIGAELPLSDAREGMRLMEEYVVPGKVVLNI